jgi:hypothetical protein
MLLRHGNSSPSVIHDFEFRLVDFNSTESATRSRTWKRHQMSMTAAFDPLPKVPRLKNGEYAPEMTNLGPGPRPGQCFIFPTRKSKKEEWRLCPGNPDFMKLKSMTGHENFRLELEIVHFELDK